MSPNNKNSGKTSEVVTLTLEKCEQFRLKKVPSTKNILETCSPEKVTVSSLVGELLCDIYGKMEVKKRVSSSTRDLLWQDSDRSGSSKEFLLKDVNSLKKEKSRLEKLIVEEGNQLMVHLKKKNLLLVKREAYYDMITAYIQAVSSKTKEDTKMKFSLSPSGETGFSQWLHAMKMVAQLPGGMPSEFRTKLWLQLSEKYLNDQNVDWEKAEAIIFNEWTNPDDEELGVQIVKDLHRTGCSLFCGEQEHNQALLKRVLLAYARWNKNVGYCQGFNMLAALILQVMDKNEKNAIKVMIYLIEGVLPESYFANNLQGLSVDMAVFRDLLRLRLPKLSKHLETLQHDTNSGTSYEPPLTNVFTMQWFLTLFSNCLPQQTVLRVWDLVFLYGNEVLLRTALAIWGILQDRVITVESADEFYSIMGVVTREMLEFGLMDSNTLVKTISMVDPFQNELQELREKYLYNISPWAQSVQSAARKGIKLFYGDPDDQEDTEDEDKIALTTAYGVFRRRESAGRELQVSGPTLDIGILKQQYAKLRQRQRQAHVIITAACNSNIRGNITSGPSVSVNHLLMGKSALINKGRRIGPPEGSIPPRHYKKGNVKEAKESNSEILKETSRQKNAEDKKLESESNKGEKTICTNERNKSKKESEEGKVKTNHDRTEDEISEESVHKSLMKKNVKSSSESSSTSTGLCDDECSDSEGNSETFEFCVRSEALDTVQTSTGEPKFLEKIISLAKEHEVEFNKNLNCDKNEIRKIKELANKLVNEIESDLQNSNELQSEEINYAVEMCSNGDSKMTEVSPAKVQNHKFDNTSEIITSLESGDLFRSDNISRLDPEVPTRGNLVETTNKNKTLQGEVQAKNANREKISDEKNIQRKSDLGLSVIKENLQMLNKFSQRSTESKRGQIEKEEEADLKINFAKKQSEVDEIENEEIEKKIKEADFLCFSKENHFKIFEKTELQESFLPSKTLNTERIMTAEKGLITEKVNKEVNTEITFGAEEVNIYACDVRFRSKEDLKGEMAQEKPESPVPKSGNAFRNLLYDDKDNNEIKAKIEVSKSDWMMKMQKIAELESTTREALSEMQAKSIDRKPTIHESLNLNFRCDHSEVDFPSESDRELIDAEIPASSSFEEFNRRREKNSELSFDAITSRTEKLLGNVEFGRLKDDPIGLSLEFEYRKPKEFGSKFVSSQKSNDSDRDSDFCYEPFEFHSSPSSPEHRFVSKYFATTKHFNSESYFAKETNFKEIFSQKCSPEKKRLNPNADSHSAKSTFNPFPKKIISKPKEVGMKLGLYPTSGLCPEGQLKKF